MQCSSHCVGFFEQLNSCRQLDPLLYSVGNRQSYKTGCRSQCKVQHACRQSLRQGMIACNNHNMCNPIAIPTSVNTKEVRHGMIVDAIILPLSVCILHFDLVSILFGTLTLRFPTSFNILVKMFLHLYIYIRVFFTFTLSSSSSLPLPLLLPQ